MYRNPLRADEMDGCLKRRFRSRGAAERVLKQIQQRAKERGKITDSQTVYGPCPEGNYHLSKSLLARNEAIDRVPFYNALVDDREGGKCARCGQLDWFYRRIRGGGYGSASIRSIRRSLRPSNLVLMCHPCNRRVGRSADGKAEGWTLDRFDDPLVEPLLYRGEWMLLDDDGGIRPYG